MTGRYAKLNNEWFLRGWSDLPKAVVNSVTSYVHKLNNREFYILEACDGKTDFNSLAFLSEHHILLDELIREGIVKSCHEGDSIELCQQYRKADNPRLTGIDWCVTGRCNLKCRHCYMESPSERYGELSLMDMTLIVEQFERANVLHVALTGGEPFIRKDILSIIALLAKKNIRLSQIFSNGLLITKNHLSAIKEIGFLPSFQISFDGVGAHDQMRGVKGIESTVLKVIDSLCVAGFPVVIATSIDRMNINQLYATYELIKGLGILSWRISVPQKTGNWREATTGLLLHETVDVCASLLERWFVDSKPFHIQLAGLYSGAPNVKTYSTEQQTHVSYSQDDFDCNACREQPNLLPDGTLVPCPGYVDSDIQAQMPNLLYDMNLSEAWTNSPLREILDMQKKNVLSENPECSTCELFEECGTGCRASALAETGKLMAKDPIACNLWKNGYKKYFDKMAEIYCKETR